MGSNPEYQQHCSVSLLRQQMVGVGCGRKWMIAKGRIDGIGAGLTTLGKAYANSQ